ncbi:hypothetical protein Q7C36_011325 [Tachysurus vachellii]|uniref:Coiled-coil domain containing 28A n=1 Tax=Tachysurus vachellii TaxID=175792 RepID=A0AA88MQK2_TACVA|nr:hypothetical protein Q7C36_011325 [Tachysurus vachellii]
MQDRVLPKPRLGTCAIDAWFSEWCQGNNIQIYRLNREIYSCSIWMLGLGRMEERKMKRKSPRPSTNQVAPPIAVRKNLNSSRTLGFTGTGTGTGTATATGTRSQQKTKLRRGVKDKPKLQSQLSNQAGSKQHSFLTDVSDVQEMEKGLLSLLNDFHSGKLQAFGNECSIDKMEHVREMQEKLARLHFDLNAEVDDMPVDQRKLACDTNMDKLLLNLEELSSSIQKLNLADNQDAPKSSSNI